jgi:anthranilate 1,2-dioxygenase small subunit
MDLAAIQRRLEIEGLYTAYAHCLDDDRLEEWPEFFTADCAYRVTSAENFEAGLPLGIIYATSKNMLVDRVMALRQANIYEPQRYRHLISCVEIANGEGTAGVSPAENAGGRDGRGRDALDARANFLVVRTMQDGAMTLFAAGRYIDRIVRAERGWKFAEKQVILDSRQIDTLLALPL